MAKFKSLTPILIVQSVDRAVDFYRDVLGFDVVNRMPQSGRADWALLRLDDVEIMLEDEIAVAQDLSEYDVGRIGASVIFYIEVSDVRGLHSRLRERIKLTRDLHATPYGANEFTMRDLNGYYLTFSEGSG